MKYFMIFLVLVGFIGLVYAEHGKPHPEPTPQCPEGTILKNDTCIETNPVCGEGTTYQEGICVVTENNENDENNVSVKWGEGLQNRVIDSPLKQSQSGIPVNEIQCKQNLVLIQKYDGTPACVTESTKLKLIERGWARNNPSRVANPDISITNKQIPKSELVPVKITGTTTFQICSIMGIPCPTNPTYGAMYDSKTEHTTFDVSVGINIYNFTLSTSKICYTIDGLNDRYCEPLDNSLISEGAGNNYTLLSKDVVEWKNMSDEQLNQYYEYYGDGFYTELGRMLIKDRILDELDKQNIKVENYGESISVNVSMINDSLPPQIYYDTIVNSTNGEPYKFSGMTHSNKILEFSSEIEN